MKRALILIYLYASLGNIVNNQTNIPLPTYKGEKFEEHQKYYEEWVESINNYNRNLNSDKVISHNDKATLYYNRFNTYYKALPDDSTDILYIFFDAFNYDKDYFCERYLSIIKNTDIHNWVKPSYGKVSFNMNRVCESVFQSYNKQLIKRLELMKERDQRYRIGDVDMKKQTLLDSLNMIEIDSIISSYGYPNRNIVGIEYEHYLVYTLLHSNLEYMEKYYPLIEKTIDQNLLAPRHIANLYDRIEMLNDRSQKYGTQSTLDKDGKWVLYKLVDKYNVNKFREEIGFRKLEKDDFN